MQHYAKKILLKTSTGDVFTLSNPNNEVVGSITGNFASNIIKVADEKNTIVNTQGLNDVREFQLVTTNPITELGGIRNYVAVAFNKKTENDYRKGVEITIECFATSSNENFIIVMKNCIVNFNDQTLQGVTGEDRKNEYSMSIKCHLAEIERKTT